MYVDMKVACFPARSSQWLEEEKYINPLETFLYHYRQEVKIFLKEHGEEGSLKNQTDTSLNVLKAIPVNLLLVFESKREMISPNIKSFLFKNYLSWLGASVCTCDFPCFSKRTDNIKVVNEGHTWFVFYGTVHHDCREGGRSMLSLATGICCQKTRVQWVLGLSLLSPFFSILVPRVWHVWGHIQGESSKLNQANLGSLPWICSEVSFWLILNSTGKVINPQAHCS